MRPVGRLAGRLAVQPVAGLLVDVVVAVRLVDVVVVLGDRAKTA